MAFEAHKCNEPNCKGFIVFENADFDFNNLQTGDSGFYEFTSPKCRECGKQYHVVPHYTVISIGKHGDCEDVRSACITEFERREKEIKG